MRVYHIYMYMGTTISFNEIINTNLIVGNNMSYFNVDIYFHTDACESNIYICIYMYIYEVRFWMMFYCENVVRHSALIDGPINIRHSVFGL